MKYIVSSTDGYGPKLFKDFSDARECAMTYLYVCDESSHVDIFHVDKDAVTKSSLYWEDNVDEAIEAYKRANAKGWS
jgi:hypothetical protein